MCNVQGEESVWKLSVLPARFYYKPKTAQKNKVYEMQPGATMDIWGGTAGESVARSEVRPLFGPC